MLNLHIRLFNMEYCTLILLGLLPAAWGVVGCLLLVLLLIMLVLLVLKSREVAVLKKEVFELRDTMRMMRYEEASLARMLHTSKPKDSIENISEEKPETSVVQEAAVKENVDDDKAEELKDDVEKENSEELLEENFVNEQPEGVTIVVEPIEDAVVKETISEDKTIEEQLTIAQEEAESLLIDPVEEVLPPVAVTHKQSINERRPAIPTDLFSAWFAENETTVDEAPVSVVEPEDLSEGSLTEQVKLSVAMEDSALAEASEETVAEQAVDKNIVESATEESVPAKAISSAELSKEDERFYRKLERIVNARLRNPNLNIDIIASQFGIGRTNFYRKVREVTGMSPNDYLRKCRMERAAELLSNSQVTVSDVCTQVGIPDAQYFSRVFKAFYGISPSIYRDNNIQ